MHSLRRPVRSGASLRCRENPMLTVCLAELARTLPLPRLEANLDSGGSLRMTWVAYNHSRCGFASSYRLYKYHHITTYPYRMPYICMNAHCMCTDPTIRALHLC